jgi:hypothetical protein
MQRDFALEFKIIKQDFQARKLQHLHIQKDRDRRLVLARETNVVIIAAGV